MSNYLGIGFTAAQALNVRVGPAYAERLGRYIATQIEQEREDCALLMERLGAIYINWSTSRRQVEDAAQAIRERGKNAATGESL